jgi:hypothetical protein
LPHEKYKPHLNDDEKVNARLEKKKKTFWLSWLHRQKYSFKWLFHYKCIIPVISKLSNEELLSQPQKWFYNHVWICQYFLQIVKFYDEDCSIRPQSFSLYAYTVSVWLIPPSLPTTLSLSFWVKLRERSKMA